MYVGQTSVKMIGGGGGGGSYNVMSMDMNVGQQSLMMDPTDCFSVCVSVSVCLSVSLSLCLSVHLCVQDLYRYGNTYVLRYSREDGEWEQKLKFPTEVMRMVEKNCRYPMVIKCASSGAHLCNCNGDCFDHFNAVTAICIARVLVCQ